MIKKSNITKIIGATTFALSLSIQNVYADRIVSTKDSVTTFEIGCTVTVQKPTCNTDEKHILPAANDYGNFNLQPNGTAQISIINSDSKKIGFNVDVEVKGYIINESTKNTVTIATIKNINSQKPFIVKNNHSKAVRAFIAVKNLTLDASPSLMNTAQIKVLGKVSFQESYTTKVEWEKILSEVTPEAKKLGFSQPFGCTVNIVNEQCNSPFMYPISRGESINVSTDFGPNPPKNPRADWQVYAIYFENENPVATTLSTVQTSYKNETKIFINNTGRTVYVSPKIINFTHKDVSTRQSQVTISFKPDSDFKK